MDQISIHSDQGEIKLRKSKALVGLKMAQTRGLLEPDYINKEVHQSLGGFKVVELSIEDTNVNAKLDEVRAHDEVEVGTHVYYPENSDRPLIATGEIFITYHEGVSDEEQMVALNEFNLELVERSGPNILVAKVTAQSPNPIKTATLCKKAAWLNMPNQTLILFSISIFCLLTRSWPACGICKTMVLYPMPTYNCAGASIPKWLPHGENWEVWAHPISTSPSLTMVLI